MVKNWTFFKSVLSLVQANNHTNIHVLKMDIEPSEWFSELVPFAPPYQIIVEPYFFSFNIYCVVMLQQVFAYLCKSAYWFINHEVNPGLNGFIDLTLLRVFCWNYNRNNIKMYNHDLSLIRYHNLFFLSYIKSLQRSLSMSFFFIWRW